MVDADGEGANDSMAELTLWTVRVLVPTQAPDENQGLKSKSTGRYKPFCQYAIHVGVRQWVKQRKC